MNIKALVLGTNENTFTPDGGKEITYYRLSAFLNQETIVFKTTKEVHESIGTIDDPKKLVLELEFASDGRAKVITAK